MTDSHDIPYGYCHCGCGEKTRIAPRNIRKSGQVKGEPFRFIRGHHARLPRVGVEPLTSAEKSRRYRERHRERANANATKWRLNNPERFKQVKREFYERNRDRLLKERRARYEADREKELARVAVANALRAGRLHRGSCEVGEGCRGRIEAHHDDYDKPLEIRWLCGHHHAELHCG